MLKIALTGASGVVGRAIIKEATKHGYQLVCLDRIRPSEGVSNHPFIQLDTADFDQLRAAFQGCDAVIHMAAIPVPDTQPDHVVHNNNVAGSYNVMRAAVGAGIKRICQASSVNAIGHSFSRSPRYDCFPLDEKHRTYAEDPYSLSKWICEQQADAIARRWEDVSIASMRLHKVVEDRAEAAGVFALDTPNPRNHLFAYTRSDAAARACLLSIQGKFRGHEVFNIVAPDTTVDVPSLDLARQLFPDVAIKGNLAGRSSFFSSAKAEEILGWKHDLESAQAAELGPFA